MRIQSFYIVKSYNPYFLMESLFFMRTNPDKSHQKLKKERALWS